MTAPDADRGPGDHLDRYRDHGHVMVCSGCGFVVRSNVELDDPEWKTCPVCEWEMLPGGRA